MSSERDNPIYFSNQTYFLSAKRSPDVVWDGKPDMFQNHTFFSANINPYWIWFGNIYGAFPLTWHWFTLRFLREPLLALFNLNKPFMTYRNIWFIFQRFMLFGMHISRHKWGLQSQNQLLYLGLSLWIILKLSQPNHSLNLNLTQLQPELG